MDGAQDTSYFISTETSTETITRILTVSSIITYYDDNNDPTLTLTGPITSIETKTITTEVVAGGLTTSTSYPSWDPVPYLDYFIEGPSGYLPPPNASIASEISSFISYGRQPACTSDYSAFIATAPTITQTFPVGVETTTLRNSKTTDYIAYDTLTAQAVAGDGFCCWYCSLYYTNLQVRYWPATDANTACLGTQTSSMIPLGNATSALQPRATGPVVATGPDGFVYTSPSIYVAFPTISGVDGCGQVGPIITSLTLAFAPGELSSVTGANPGPVQGTTVVFNPADLPCGPNNGTNEFLPDPVNATSYLPLIALPSKLLALRPDWASCTNDFWEGQDPPYALSPATGLGGLPAPSAWPTSGAPVPDSTPASPASSAIAPPASTGMVLQSTDELTAPSQDPGPSSSNALASKTPTNSAPASSNYPPALPNSSPASPNPPSASSAIPPTSPYYPPLSGTSLSYDPNVIATPSSPPAPVPSSQLPSAPPSAVIVQGQTVTNNAAPITVQGTPIAYTSGALIIGSSTQPIVVPIQTQWSPTPVVAGGFTFTPAPQVASPVSIPSVTVGGQVITPVAGSSGAIIMQGQTVVQGQGLTTVGTVPVLVSGGSVYVNGQGTAIPTAPAAVAPAVITSGIVYPSAIIIAGQTVSAVGSSAVVVGTQTLTAGQPAVTISGVPFSLGPSGLVAGSSTIALPTPSSYVVIASETIDLASSDVVVGGVTLTPGSPATTISGVLVSLGSSVLVVGSTTETFAPSPSVSGGLGALILSGLGGGPAPAATGNGTSPYGITPFKGDAIRSHGAFASWMGALVLLAGCGSVG
ncbi:hypothetical protein MMC19_003138 [Ptychographa xylographoides]|nr:hypothetical protein [Ptychographa xylographoides]